MYMKSVDIDQSRLETDAGIAIGPILFIIAVLGILAAAIAAGSGSFTTSTTIESNKTKASALIEIGQNLKVGFDRIVGYDVALTAVDVDPTHTSCSTCLFSPTGGGISPPSTTMSETPGTDTWIYHNVTLPAMGIGTGTSPNKVAFLKVTSGVCDQINLRANAVTTPSVALTATTGDITHAAPDDWPATLAGIPTGCFRDSTANVYWFYQVIGVQ